MKTNIIKIVFAAMLVAAIVGCKDKDVGQNETGAVNADGMADSADLAAADLAKTPDPKDPCRLLEPKEVEAVLGAPLAFAPYRGGNPIGDSAAMPDETGYYCWYFTSDNRNLTVQAEWTDAGAINAGVSGNLAKAEDATKGMLKLQDGTELVGDWDEAKMRGCCTFVAIQGDSSVEIDFGGSLNTTAEQAAGLANKALPRLTKPLDINGLAGQKDGLKRILALYASDDPCALWSAADIAKLLGPQKGAPERSGNECTIRYNGKDGKEHLFVANITLRNGYRNYRGENATFEGFAKNINAEGADQGVALRASKGVEGPWEAASDGAIQFNSVKRDAQISIRHGGMGDDDLRAFIGHGYARIEAGAKK